MNASTISAYIAKLENENKLLREEVHELNDDAAEYRIEIFRLKAVIEDLEEELDEDYDSDEESVVSTDDEESDDESDEESDEESDDEDDFHISRNAAIVNVLRKLSDLEKDDFKSKAYWKAAEAVDNIPYTIVDGESLAKGETKVAGIGKSIAKKIDEFLETGIISRLEELKKKPPTTNECIFDALGEVAARESDVHKKAAYKKAAQAIKNLDFEVTSGEELAKGPNKVAGIGKSIGRKIDNFLQFGEMK